MWLYIAVLIYLRISVLGRELTGGVHSTISTCGSHAIRCLGAYPQVGWAILQYYHHYAILGYMHAISISQTFYIFTCQYYCICNISQNITTYRRHLMSDGLNKYISTIITRC